MIYSAPLCKGIRIKKLFVLFIAWIFLSIPFELTSQNLDECSTTISEEHYQAFVNEVPAVLAYLAAENTPLIVDIPVRITVFRKDDGSGINSTIDQTFVDAALAFVTNTFSTETFFTFVQCGDVNYVNNTYLYNQGYPQYVNSFEKSSHVSNAINLFFTGTSFRASLPCLYFYEQFGVPCEDLDETGEDSYITLGGLTSFGASGNFHFTHELGHHFGLLHTHGFKEDPLYVTPVGPLQDDHPVTGKWPRELVIRENEPPSSTKEFTAYNWHIAGDLLRDTPPEGRSNQLTFPGWSMNGCTYNGTYVDYNGDPTASTSDYQIGSSYMSKAGGCRSLFSSDQGGRINRFYEEHRQFQYNLPFCNNWTDKVEFEGTDIGMDRIGIEIEHPTTLKYCNTLTNPDGYLHGVLFEDDLTANVFFLGSGPNLDYTYDDWKKNVNIIDFWYLQLAINSIPPFVDNFSGYTKIAADVNKDGIIDNVDRDLVKDLVLGNIQSFPNHNQPYRFTPEYIPQDFENEFNTDPFNMTLNGITYINEAPYLEKDWEYTITNGNNDKGGFDAIKLGDVTHPRNSPFPPIIVNYTKEFAAGNIVKFNFNIEDFIEVSAYEIEIGFDTAHLNYQAAYPKDLTGVTQDLFGTQQITEGKIKAIWYSEHSPSETLNDFDEIFQLEFSGIGDYLNAEVWLNSSNFYDTSGFFRAIHQIEYDKLLNFAIDNDGNIRPIIFKENNKSAIKKVNIYPNPTDNELNLELETLIECTVKIQFHNALGELLYESDKSLNIGYNQFNLKDFNTLPSGVLFLSINANGKVLSEKIVKL